MLRVGGIVVVVVAAPACGPGTTDQDGVAKASTVVCLDG